jgi:hypothetical protein
MVGYDVNDTATYDAVNHTQTNYTQYTMSPYATFQGMKLGVPREGFFNETLSGNPPEIKWALEIDHLSEAKCWLASSIAVDAAIAKIQSLGASIQDPANLPTFNDYLYSGNGVGVVEIDNILERPDRAGDQLAHIVSKVDLEVILQDNVVSKPWSPRLARPAPIHQNT